jgi:NADH:ubiquinone oxidoreductase subunit 6 (subunit J)
MNGWKKIALVLGALDVLIFVGGIAASGVIVAVTGNEYVTPLEERVSSAGVALWLVLALVAAVLFVVGETKDGR